MNEDYNPDLYRWQDATVETLPKDMENRDLGYVLEAAGDVFRELTGRREPDGAYVGEKVERIERALAHRVDRENVFAVLSDVDQERADTLQEEWFKVKSLSNRLTAVRNLVIALADQNEAGVRFNLNRFKEEWTWDGRPKSIHRRPTRHEVRVRGHRRQTR